MHLAPDLCRSKARLSHQSFNLSRTTWGWRAKLGGCNTPARKTAQSRRSPCTHPPSGNSETCFCHSLGPLSFTLAMRRMQLTFSASGCLFLLPAASHGPEAYRAPVSVLTDGEPCPSTALAVATRMSERDIEHPSGLRCLPMVVPSVHQRASLGLVDAWKSAPHDDLHLCTPPSLGCEEDCIS